MILAGAACLTARGVAGAALYILGHGCVKGALFMCAGILMHRFGSVDQAELAGRGKKLFVLGGTFALSGLGLAGFPPFGTYLGKQMMEEAGAAVGQHWLPWVFVFSSAVSAGAVLRAAGIVFMGWGDAGERRKGVRAAEKEDRETVKAHRQIPVVMMTAAIILALGPLVSAFFGTALATTLESAGERFTNQPVYARAVLGQQLTGPLELKQPVRPTAQGLIFGFTAAAGAMAIALAALFQHHLSEAARRGFHAALNPILASLRAIHTGHVGDLIVWLVIGVVVIGIG